MSEQPAPEGRRTYLLEIAPRRGPAAARRAAVAGDEPLGALRVRLERELRLGAPGLLARADAPNNPLPDEGTFESLGLSVGDALAYATPVERERNHEHERKHEQAHATAASASLSPTPAARSNGGWWLRIVDVYAGPPAEAAPPAVRALALRITHAASARAEWDVDPNGGDRRPRLAVESDLALAEEVFSFVSNDRARYEQLAHEGEASLTEWLVSLPDDLASHGQWSAALEFCERGAAVGPAAPFLCHRADLLLRAGRRAEAIAQAEHVVARFGEDPTALARVASVFYRLGDDPRAESLCRTVLASAPDVVSLRDGIDDDAWFARLDAAETLVTLLRARGRYDEAALLEQQELVGPDADVGLGDPGAGPHHAPRDGMTPDDEGVHDDDHDHDGAHTQPYAHATARSSSASYDAPLLVDDPPMEHTGIRPSRHPPPPQTPRG